MSVALWICPVCGEGHIQGGEAAARVMAYKDKVADPMSKQPDERHDDPIEFALLKLQDWQRPGTLAWSRDGLEALIAMRRKLAEAQAIIRDLLDMAEDFRGRGIYQEGEAILDQARALFGGDK